MRPDAIDRQILRELQDDGRMSNVELARRVGMSPPPCLRRVRALEEAGFITGYRALLDAKALGYEVTAFAMVHLASQAEPDLAAFEAFVRDQPRSRSRRTNGANVAPTITATRTDAVTVESSIAIARSTRPRARLASTRLQAVSDRS